MSNTILRRLRRSKQLISLPLAFLIFGGIFSTTNVALADEISAPAGTTPAAQEQSIESVVVTMDPFNTQLTGYNSFKTSESVSNFSAPSTTPSEVFGDSSNSFALIVNQNLYPQIESAILRYIDDVQLDGYTVILHQIDNTGNPADLKQILINDHSAYQISGAFFIGELPIAWYESIETWNDNEVSYPTDY